MTLLRSTDAPPLLAEWLGRAVTAGASDLHLVPGYPPVMRVQGRLAELTSGAIMAETARELLTAICPPALLERFETSKNVDFALELELGQSIRRFRGNLFLSGQCMGGCLRIIPARIPDLAWAGFPPPLAERIIDFRNGLVVISGVTGSGKTTTLAMLIDRLNKAGGCRIITVEEPVEYLFEKAPGSVVTQREVGQDVDSFADGLKYGLRQDPDILLVGEIRDRETARMALSAAETGHLVFTTLHTRDAKGAVSRLVDLFPQNVQSDVRSQLALSLRAVISQHLLPSFEEGEKRELALEVMFNNSPIANAIRMGKLETIDNNILTGRADGMVTLDESIRRLLLAGRVSRAVAERFASDPGRL